LMTFSCELNGQRKTNLPEGYNGYLHGFKGYLFS
jgi:hypothetical protein